VWSLDEESRHLSIKTFVQSYCFPLSLSLIEVCHGADVTIRVPIRPCFVVDVNKCIVVPKSWLKELPETDSLALNKARVNKRILRGLIQESVSCVDNEAPSMELIRKWQKADLKDIKFRLATEKTQELFAVVKPQDGVSWCPIYGSVKSEKSDALESDQASLAVSQPPEAVDTPHHSTESTVDDLRKAKERVKDAQALVLKAVPGNGDLAYKLSEALAGIEDEIIEAGQESH
jgi:hypothetical protein